MAEDNKLMRFKNAVFTEAENRADNLISKARKDAEKKRKDIESTVLSKEKSEFLKIEKNSQARIVREISAKQLNSKRNVLLYRKSIENKVLTKVEENLKEFRNSGEYDKYLLKLADACINKFPGEEGIVFLGRQDEKYAEIIREKTGVEVKIDPTVVLGGLAMSFPQINVLLDCTFDSALEEEKENFCNISELAL
ncbi:MAG: V-type ATP synthase subunit E [Oscillospiraceae bacterium]